jgi:hypothetical protein
VLGLVLALAATPAIVLASHQFSDVPDSNSFHGQISSLVGAGITNGCGPTTFCPKATVTREQMAAFLGRGLGYAAANTGTLLASETFSFYLTDLTLPARSVTGGTNYVRVSGDVTVFDDSGTCPCGAILTVVNLDTGDFAPETFFVVGSDEVDGAMTNTGSVNWVFEVPSGTAQDFALDVIAFPNTPEPMSTDGIGEADAVVFGNLTAEYVPFGSTVEYAPIDSMVPEAYREQLDRLHAR